jgi:hypothetical protein
MTLSELLIRLNESRITLALTPQCGISYRAPKGALTPELADALTTQREELIAALRPAPVVPGLLYHMYSTVLDCEFWIMETDAQAQEQRLVGRTAYSEREVWLLREMKQRPPEGYEEKLRAISQCQAVFAATIDRVEPPVEGEKDASNG